MIPAIDLIIIIGMLPKSSVRARLTKEYDDREAYIRLLPAGLGPELRPKDLDTLTLKEKASFLKGAALILEPRLRLRDGQDCTCSRPCVLLPVAAFTSLLREDVELARKAWKDFAQIPRLCAEKFPIIAELVKDDASPNADESAGAFDRFISSFAPPGSLPSDISPIFAAEKIEKEYRIVRMAGRTELDPEEGN